MKREITALACTAVLAALIFFPATIAGHFDSSVVLNGEAAVASGSSSGSGLFGEDAWSDTAQRGNDAGEEGGQGISSESELGYEPDVVIVEVADVLTLDEVNAELATLDFIATDHIEASDVNYGFLELSLAEGVSVDDAIARMNEVEFAAFAQPNYVYHIVDETAEDATTATGSTALQPGASMTLQDDAAQSATINDPRASEQWALTAIKAYDAWDVIHANHKVTVAVLDSGLDMDHPDFTDAAGTTNVVGGYSVSKANSGGDASDYDDAQGHGTHVAGIISAATNNNTGIAGASYNANIMPVQVIDSDGTTTTKDSAIGVNYIVSNASKYNVKVINISLGINATGATLDSDDRMFISALKRAHDADILVVCSAGNEGSSGAYENYPSDFDPEAIGVINIKKNGDEYVRHSSSNYNLEGLRTKELSAPGTDILSTTFDGAYGMQSGTSMAAPYVAGVAALVFAENPNITAKEAKQVLIDTAQDLNTSANIDGQFDLETGYGLVDADAAVRASASYLSEGDVLQVGGTLQLSVENPLGRTWSWSSDNESVATVDSSGNVSGKAAGTVTITAAAGSVKLTRTMYVFDPAISGPDSLSYGSTGALSVSASNPSSAWVWTSSDSGVVYVNRTSGAIVARGVGDATITVALNGNASITSTKKIVVTQASLEQATLYNVEDQTYTGEDITLPNLGVYMPGIGWLASGTDYEVAYANNHDKGTATVTVTGKGRFTDEKSATFKIGEATIKDASITGTGSYVYTGKEITVPDLVVTSSTSESLKEGRDYKVTYENNVNVGMAYITVTGIGNYVGEVTKSFSITAVSIASDAVSMTGIADATYTGSAIMPKPTLTYNGMTLAEGTDYQIAYTNNVNAGTATMYVRGLGNYATYIGIYPFIYQNVYRTATFMISPADMSSVSVTFGACAYNGTAQRPDPVITFNGKTLSSGIYCSITYPDDCTNAGEKRVTLSAKSENFTGSTQASYTVEKKAATITVANAKKVYDGTPLEGSYTSDGFVDGELASVTVNGSITNVGTATAKVNAFTVKGDGVYDVSGNPTATKNYTVTTRDGTLEVTAAPITVWRLYDTRTGEHHYTSDANERDVLLSWGNWNDEGTAWVTPSTSSTPVYRVYDLWTGEHHYTSDKHEQEVLVGSGRWRDEGVAWYSDDAKTCKVFRIERHDLGPLQHHHYTVNERERNICITEWNWNDEGIGWYALSAS